MKDYTWFVGLKCTVRTSSGRKYYGTVISIDGNANLVWVYLSDGKVNFKDGSYSTFTKAFVLGVTAIESLETPK